jgi:hypothetical protein
MSNLSRVCFRGLPRQPFLGGVVFSKFFFVRDTKRPALVPRIALFNPVPIYLSAHSFLRCGDTHPTFALPAASLIALQASVYFGLF